MAWKFHSKLPVSYQIAEKLRLDILNGLYEPGMQFPTVRQLAVDASVNPNTVQKALLQLETEGLLITQGTVGRFVTDDVQALESAREVLRREFVIRVMAEAAELGITKAAFLDALTRLEEEV